jgi:hypothetical protein
MYMLRTFYSFCWIEVWNIFIGVKGKLCLKFRKEKRKSIFTFERENSNKDTLKEQPWEVVCMCACVCVCLHACVCACMSLHVWERVQACVSVHVWMCVWACVYSVRMCAWVSVHVCASMCACVWIVCLHIVCACVLVWTHVSMCGPTSAPCVCMHVCVWSVCPCVSGYTWKT